MIDPPRPGLVRMFLRGLTKRCPRCGGRRLFQHWVTIRERCPTCGYRFEREEGFLLGVMAMNIIFTSILFTVYLVVSFVLTVPDPPVLALVIGGVALTAVAPVVLYPYAKTTWAAIDLAMRPLEVVEEAEAVTFVTADGDPADGGRAPSL